MNTTKKTYIREYKQKKRLEDPETERVFNRIHNRLSYYRKTNTLDEKFYQVHGLLTPDMITIRDALQSIAVVLRKNGNDGQPRERLIAMIDEII
jgi:hypothetical protein